MEYKLGSNVSKGNKILRVNGWKTIISVNNKGVVTGDHELIKFGDVIHGWKIK